MLGSRRNICLQEYRNAGNTVFFSSHILADIEEICDRIAVMHVGRLIYVGTPVELMASQGGQNQDFLATVGAADAA